MRYKSVSYRVFTIFNTIGLAFLAFLCIMPVIHVLAVAFSGKAAATAHLVNFWPVNFTTEAFTETLSNTNFLRSLVVSFVRTILGTGIFVVITVLTAYPLSKYPEDFKGRNMYIWFFVFTMLFGGGLVPTYLLITNLKMINSIWALVLPGAVNVWSIIMMMNFFRSLPKELEEAARIDGAGDGILLVRIFLPLLLPSIATLSLFNMVGHWNSWFDGMIYNTDSAKYPLATLLQTIIVQQDFSKVSLDPKSLENFSQRTVKCAQIFIGALPIMMVYPFLQKYFVKGVVLGAVKG